MMLWNYLTLLKEISWHDLLDIALTTCLIWAVLHTLRTTRTRKIGIGLLGYGVVLLITGQMGLKLTAWILQGLTAVVILIVIVVYQSEIRRLLERLPSVLSGRQSMALQESAGLADSLNETLKALVRLKRGALIVLSGRDPLQGVISAGIPLKGHFSKALLLSIFDPNSPGHDGAVVLRGEQVDCFGCRLPLSEQEAQLAERGTRHAAALGLSEKSDALVLVVSEETGCVSVAREGRLQTFPEAQFPEEEILGFLGEHAQQADEMRRFKKHLLWNGLEGGAAILTAAILWLVLVPGSVLQTATYEVPVEVQNIPEGYSLAKVTPNRVSVTLIAGKHTLFQVNPGDLVIRLDGTLTTFGRKTYPITKAHLLLPPDVDIVDLIPEQVQVTVKKVN